MNATDREILRNRILQTIAPLGRTGLPMIEMGIKYSIGNRMSAPRQSGELLVVHPELADKDNVVPFKRTCKVRAA